MTNSPDLMGAMDIQRIFSLLPHRYPLLLVDRVVACVPEESITAYKNISINEPFFQGHFPGLPVMPGVLIMEALAQAGGLMAIANWKPEEAADMVFLFTGMENVRFRAPVYPGDRLDLDCALIRRKMKLWKITGKATVDGRLAAEGTLSAAIMAKKDL
jgi:3-hydroxyacyl-[acyl-carrier-protein] dehydratase